MKDLIFLVRPWNVDFVDSLVQYLSERKEVVNCHFWTMQINAYWELQRRGLSPLFLPEEFESTNYDLKEIAGIDNALHDNFGIGLKFLYEIERFKPQPEESEKFIAKQVSWFRNNLPRESILLSLTCDHFVYILAGYINRLKGGKNLYLIPTGFPLNANVVKSSPWELYRFRKDPLPKAHLEEYAQSLQLDPFTAIHYMNKVKPPSLFKRICAKLKPRTKIRKHAYKGIFDYIPPDVNRRSIVQRLRPSDGFDIPEKYCLKLSQIQELTNGRKVFYFPLQFEPEMSILAYSPFHKDQLEAARVISQVLDFGDLLIIKENPKMIGRRSSVFYEKISKLHNIKWVDPRVNSRDIIRIVFKTIAITGTATVEAAVMGRGSLIFGHPPFRTLLLEAPVMDLPLSKLRDYVYRAHTKDKIIQQVENAWGEYSRSVLFGDYIPKRIDGKWTTDKTKELSRDFCDKVLHEELRANS